MGIRKDINDLVRDKDGFLSKAQIGMLLGQGLAVKMILEHGSEIISNWDSLLVLFAVLIAPDMFKRMVNLKYGNGHSVTESQSTTQSTSTTTVGATNESPRIT